VLFRGGELDGRFALLPKGTATAALAAAPTTARGALDEDTYSAYINNRKGNREGKKRGGSRVVSTGLSSSLRDLDSSSAGTSTCGALSAAALAGDCRYLCHASDPRWSWRPVRAEPHPLPSSSSSSSSRRRRTGGAAAAFSSSAPRFTGLWQRTPTLARRVAVSSASHAAHLSAQPLPPPPLPPPLPLSADGGFNYDGDVTATIPGSSELPEPSSSCSSSSSSAAATVAAPAAVASDRNKRRPPPPSQQPFDPRNVMKLEALAEASEQRRARKAAQKEQAQARRWLSQWEETRRIAKATLHPSSLGYPTFQRFDPFFQRSSQHHDGAEDSEERKKGAEATRDRQDCSDTMPSATSPSAAAAAAGSRRSKSQTTAVSSTSNRKKGGASNHVPPLRVAVLRLVSFSLRERGGVAEPSADLRLDVRHFKHPSVALSHPTGCGPGQGKAQALDAIAAQTRKERKIAGEANASAAAVQAVVAQAAGVGVGDSSAISGHRSPSPKRSRHLSPSSIDWGSDEEPFPEDTCATTRTAAAEKSEEETEGTAAGRDDDEGRGGLGVEETPLVQPTTKTGAQLASKAATARILPWWYSRTGLDSQVQAAVAAEEAKLGEVQRLVDATLFRLAMQHHRPEALAHAAALAAAAATSTTTTTTTTSGGGGSSSSSALFSSVPLSMPPMVRPTRSAAISSVVKQHGYSDAKDISGDRYAASTSSSKRANHDYSKPSVHIANQGSSSSSSGGVDENGKGGLVVTVSFACYEGRLRAVAVAELIAQHMRRREDAQRAAATSQSSSRSRSSNSSSLRGNSAVLSVEKVEVCHWELLNNDDDGIDDNFTLTTSKADTQSPAPLASQPVSLDPPHKRPPSLVLKKNQLLLSSSERISARRIGRRRRSSSGSFSRGRSSDKEGSDDGGIDMDNRSTSGKEGDLLDKSHSLRRPRSSSTSNASRTSTNPNRSSHTSASAAVSSPAVAASSVHSSLPPLSSSSSSSAPAAAETSATAATSWVKRSALEDQHGVAEGALWLSWSEAWGALRRRGWVRHIGTGIDLANYYLAPGCPKPKRDGSGFAGVVWPLAQSQASRSGEPPLRGRDYFTRPEAVIAHAQRVLRAEEQEARGPAAAVACTMKQGGWLGDVG